MVTRASRQSHQKSFHSHRESERSQRVHIGASTQKSKQFRDYIYRGVQSWAVTPFGGLANEQ